jgi:hypothetical protein
MPGMNMQFHALPDEIAEILLASIQSDDVHIIVEGGLPFIAREIACADLKAEAIKAGNGHATINFYLTLSPPIFGATSRMKFLDANLGGVTINIGRLTELGLKQSALSILNGFPVNYELAKKIAKELKRVTKAGVSSINPLTGTGSVTKSFRYTSGALKLEASGTRMLPFAGGAQLVLGDINKKNDNPAG